MRTLVACFAVLALGCSCSEGDGDPDGGGDMDGRVIVGECDDDGDCEPTQVCHPFAQECVIPGGMCMSQAECTDGRYCEDGVCLAGTAGAPCESDANCVDMCTPAGVCGCSGLAHERMLMGGPLDIYFVFDRTGSMGEDCDYVQGDTPPVNSKACFATYAMNDYLIGVAPIVDTRLAFQFMSQPDDCDGVPYETPLIPLTQLPVAADHAIVQAISNETFQGGLGTHIEGALRGISVFTANNQTAGREMIGVLMTDGDPQGCEEDIGALRTIIADHYAATGIRTFIIGMEGATEQNLEELAMAGGAEPHDDYCGGITPPCHYWNVGDGSGAAIADALQAIIEQSAPIPCELPVVGLTPPEGETLDYDRVNVTFTVGGTSMTIGRVEGEASCPASQPAWYYDDPDAPTAIHLCPSACTLVSGAGEGARLDVVVGCMDSVVII